MKKLIVIFLLLLSGCELANKAEPMQEIVVDEKIVKSLENVPVEDCEIMYKQFAGLSLYIENTDKVTNTLMAEVLAAKFAQDYKYKTKRYEEFDKAFKDFMISKNYKKVLSLVDEVEDPNSQIDKQDYSSNLMIIANSIRKAMESNE